jgi:Asp/Glu/hydantoin racemase
MGQKYSVVTSDEDYEVEIENKIHDAKIKHKAAVQNYIENKNIETAEKLTETQEVLNRLYKMKKKLEQNNK